MGITRNVKVFEIELPDVATFGAEIRQLTISIREREADLNEIQEINVGLQ